ncbi:hypothetical protein AB0E69_16330 [Kribbella sp. NPDC026611]|uniref:hypothetical protein n=1 Tax=Kribbella sp. NPDC026611 TaxID=3154911 RepID=UPI0033E749A2
MLRALTRRLPYLVAAVPPAIAAWLYSLLLRDELSGDYCTPDYCEPFGSFYPTAWLIFGVASLLALVILNAPAAVDATMRVLNRLLVRRPRRKARPAPRLSWAARSVVGVTFVAGVVVLTALAAQRVLRPAGRETFAGLAFWAAGAAIYSLATICLLGVVQPRILHTRTVPALALFGRAARRDVLSLVVVSATFVLTIYSSEVWMAMLATPWYTILLLVLLLVGASVALVAQRGQSSNETRPRRTPPRTLVAGHRKLAGERDATARHSRLGGLARALLFGAVSFAGFFVIAVDLLHPDTVRTVVESTQACGFRGCADVAYASMVAKIAALLAGLATLVAAEATGFQSPGGPTPS